MILSNDSPPLSPAGVLRIGYLSTSILVILLYCVAPLRSRFLSYGVRDAVTPQKQQHEKQQKEAQSRLDGSMNKLFRPFEPLMDEMQRIRVPHSWFKHLYLIAVPLSLFWMWQLQIRGAAFQWLATRLPEPSLSATEASEQVLRLYCVWTLFFAHLCRRLYESFAFDKQSKSTMWIGHYIMGLLHYLSITIAIWLEQAHALAMKPAASSLSEIRALSLPLAVVLPSFVLLNTSQHWVHRHLYRLPSKPRINVPVQGVFRTAISPHYGSEVGIYTCLTILASSSVSSPNWTMLAVLCFVISNLSISAQNTKDKYATSYGPATVEGKSLLGLPGLCHADLTPYI